MFPWRLLTFGGFLAVSFAALAAANFASSPGFSGRVADCSACHRPPLQGDDATIHVEGLPTAWTPNQQYPFSISIRGGPVSLPTGPDAGFEIESLTGRFIVDPDEGVRSFYPTEATYTEEGVFQRQWNLTWQAPGLENRPGPVTFWLAGIAANGNHNVQLNTSDLGEYGDSVATLVIHLPPSQEAWDQWKALPLRPPVIETVINLGTTYRIEGVLGDENATQLHYNTGNGWQTREAAGAWRIETNAKHVQVYTTGSDRRSPVVEVEVPGDRQAANLSLVAMVFLIAAFAQYNRRRQG